MTHTTITIVSDTVCPWCYVGKRRLERAMAQHRAAHPDATFSVTWRPFYLNPEAPARRSEDKQAYYERRFGAERTARMQQGLSAIGRDLGIDFAYGGRVGGTRDSHRLIALGGKEGEERQGKVVQALFRAYFEDNRDITEPEVLTACGVEAGLDEGEVKKWLESGAGGDQVDREVGEAQRRHISGVPNFLINGKYEVGGAEEPELFVELFETLHTQSGDGKAVTNGGGNAC